MEKNGSQLFYLFICFLLILVMLSAFRIIPSRSSVVDLYYNSSSIPGTDKVCLSPIIAVENNRTVYYCNIDNVVVSNVSR